MGAISRAVSSCRWVVTVRGGRSVHLGAALKECLFGLCRWTALHLASLNGHTETAMALVRAGADVHCKANDGYGSRGCILMRLGCRRARRTVRPLGVEPQEWLFGCAALRR
jgi:hypothetical protein